MSRRSLALAFLLGGSVLALVLAWTTVSDYQDLTRALALVALAGSGLILVLRVRGRQVVGLLLSILGLAMALAAAMLDGPPIAWWVAYAIGGVLVAAGGMLILITAARWPAPADRFERTETGTSAVTENPADLWQAQDAGLDPTADPDVRKADPGDTMRSANQSQQSLRRK
ncbi:MAG TPA: Trp biosynthesis-associated membrane protein [Propionibacteriaceae bacterium]|nr:Trp biosynthesis-associated membrane protein [Propionibacteriaceae bacterium]